MLTSSDDDDDGNNYNEEEEEEEEEEEDLSSFTDDEEDDDYDYDDNSNYYTDNFHQYNNESPPPFQFTTSTTTTQEHGIRELILSVLSLSGVIFLILFSPSLLLLIGLLLFGFRLLNRLTYQYNVNYYKILSILYDFIKVSIIGGSIWIWTHILYPLYQYGKLKIQQHSYYQYGKFKIQQHRYYQYYYNENDNDITYNDDVP